jgi:hypothetical protein
VPTETTEKIELVVKQEVTVRIEINDPDVIERVTGPGGEEWRSQLYKLHTEADIANHLATACISGGDVNASFLDGWADLPAEAVRMEITDISPDPLPRRLPDGE